MKADREKEELQAHAQTLGEKEELQRRLISLAEDNEELQGRFTSLEQEKEELQEILHALRQEKQQLQAQLEERMEMVCSVWQPQRFLCPSGP